jgi:hypothetical protein
MGITKQFSEVEEGWHMDADGEGDAAIDFKSR